MCIGRLVGFAITRSVDRFSKLGRMDRVGNVRNHRLVRNLIRAIMISLMHRLRTPGI